MHTSISIFKKYIEHFFTLVVPTTLSSQCNYGQSQESEGPYTMYSYTPARIKEVRSKLRLFHSQLPATYLTLIYDCTYFRLSVSLGLLIKQAGIAIHT